MKYLYAFIISICLFGIAHTQDLSTERNSNTIYIGYPFGFFDTPDFGMHIGYNKEFAMKNQFSWEGQGSFIYGNYKRDSNTFAHNGGTTYGVSLLVGPRLYLMKPKSNTRIFINALFGPAYIYNSEFRNDGVSPEEFLAEEHLVSFGYSLGAYVQLRDKFVIGSALETGVFLVFKLGYKF